MMDELRRLNNAFGIGGIRLDAEHFMQSEILFSANEKESLDWDTINRLVDDNRDISRMDIKRVKPAEILYPVDFVV